MGTFVTPTGVHYQYRDLPHPYYFKLLNEDGTSVIKKDLKPWSMPSESGPGEWVHADSEDIVKAKSGLHVMKPFELLGWPLTSPLWIVETEDREEDVITFQYKPDLFIDMTVVRKARVLERVESWNQKAWYGICVACAQVGFQKLEGIDREYWRLLFNEVGDRINPDGTHKSDMVLPDDLSRWAKQLPNMQVDYTTTDQVMTALLLGMWIITPNASTLLVRKYCGDWKYGIEGQMVSSYYNLL